MKNRKTMISTCVNPMVIQMIVESEWIYTKTVDQVAGQFFFKLIFDNIQITPESQLVYDTLLLFFYRLICDTTLHLQEVLQKLCIMHPVGSIRLHLVIN